MQLNLVESSNIRAIGWEDQTLVIEFTSGGTYAYRPVPEGVFSDFISSESKGKFFHAKIKNVFPFERQTTGEGEAIENAEAWVVPVPRPDAAIENLTNCQRQLDMDGCEVGVSRQALEEVLEWLRSS